LLLLGVSGHHCQFSTESQAPFFSFFFLYVLLLVGASGFHHQLLAKGEPNLPLCRKLVMELTCTQKQQKKGKKRGIFLIFFLFFVLLLMGASECHRQVLVEGELAPYFFCFCFVNFWVPSPGLSKGGV
jgi:hypothetical protein